ncbi:hypothetical protein HYR99_35965 [Candidatus Poribacteria bacterium]|nr:hypothetical protein [Candidatus Poribacteria bacterium]
MFTEKDLPPQIRELLKKRGWTWPPDEKTREERRKLIEKSAGSLHIGREDSRQIWLEMRGHYWGDEVE